MQSVLTVLDINIHVYYLRPAEGDATRPGEMLRSCVPCAFNSYSFVFATKSIKPRVVNTMLGSCGFSCFFFLEVYGRTRVGCEGITKNSMLQAYHFYVNSSTIIKTHGNYTWPG